MLDNKKSYILNEYDNAVNEPIEFYNNKKDFTTLEAWKKCREVKLFFTIRFFLYAEGRKI